MRAVAATGRGVELMEVPSPAPTAGQVLAVPLAVGICGSDLHLVDSYRQWGTGAPPIVMGHEFCARVVEAGPGGPAGVPPGTRVVSVPYAAGPGGPELLGLSPVLPGGFGERLVLDEARLLAVPEQLPDDVAALTEPLAVGVHAAAAGELRPGEPAMVVGCGPIGLAVIAALKAAGHGPVVAADFSPARRRLAEQLGADVVVDPAASSPHERWDDLGVDELPPSPLIEPPVVQADRAVAFECVGIPGILQQLIAGVPRHSRIVVVGACIAPDTITPATAITKEVTLSFVFAYRAAEFARALDLLASGRVDGRPLVTGHVDLEGVAAAFEELRAPDTHVKVMVTP